MKYKCIKCGKEFIDRPCRNRKYCSSECSGSIKKYYKCQNCNKEFHTHGFQKFCNEKCNQEWRDKFGSPKKRRIKINCVKCNKEIEIRPFEFKKRKFCSSECRGNYVRIIKRKYNNSHKSINLNTKYKIIKKRANKLEISICSQDEFIYWYNNAIKICEYCGIPEEIWEILFYGEQHHFSLTIDRKNNNNGYIPQNMVFACGRCNTTKNKWLTYEEMKKIGEQYLKPKWKNFVSINKEVYRGK